MFSFNTLNSQNEMNNMEKKIYSRPTISETKLDSEINLVLMSGGATESGAPCEDEFGNIVPCPGFINPFKWFR